MSIDISKEELVSFTEAAKGLPRRRAGRKVHPATIHRWAADGCRGVFLDYIQIGGTRCTSTIALQRFFDELTERDRGAEAPRAPTTTRSKSILAAERRLGISSTN